MKQTQISLVDGEELASANPYKVHCFFLVKLSLVDGNCNCTALAKC